MSKPNSTAVIGLRGVRQNNLNGFDLDLPLHRLIVITGLSGSGKSSLAFDTLCAEGQRRYIETFSPYARRIWLVSPNLSSCGKARGMAQQRGQGDDGQHGEREEQRGPRA
jgi:hypothetical protein